MERRVRLEKYLHFNDKIKLYMILGLVISSRDDHGSHDLALNSGTKDLILKKNQITN